MTKTAETKESRLTEQIARLEEEKQELAQNLYQSQMMELDVRRKLEAARTAITQMQEAQEMQEAQGADGDAAD